MFLNDLYIYTSITMLKFLLSVYIVTTATDFIFHILQNVQFDDRIKMTSSCGHPLERTDTV